MLLGMSNHRVSPASAHPLRPHARGSAVAAVAVAIAASGCGETTQRAAPPPTADAVNAAATAAPAPRYRSPVPRARRLKEFREMIVRVYRIPGSEGAAARNLDPLDELSRRLNEQYGMPASS
jgi:hypothetical protein